MEFAHRPVPWKWDDNENLVDSCGDMILTFGGWGEPGNFAGYGPAEDAANARLIAASPDLLEALNGLADLYDTDEGCRSLPQYKAARVAIAKATGEAA